jgi:hypothetical protein
MPGISMSCFMPSIDIVRCVAVASGTGAPFWRSHDCMSAISSPCPTTMRSQSRTMSARAPCDAAQPAISTACAWCGIMPDMKCTSAGFAFAATIVPPFRGAVFTAPRMGAPVRQPVSPNRAKTPTPSTAIADDPNLDDSCGRLLGFRTRVRNPP